MKRNGCQARHGDPINHADPNGRNIIDDAVGAVEDTLIDPAETVESAAEEAYTAASGCIAGVAVAETATSTAQLYVARD